MVALLVILAIIVIIALRAVRIISEWRRAVVLRLGRFKSVSGPGVFFIIPFVDQVAFTIDMRISTTSISAEQALTRDTVSVGVDAIIFWKVIDASAAAMNIINYREAVERVAQTSLREMIGATDLGTLLSDRRSIDEHLRNSIGTKTSSWGITVNSVEIRDVAIPAGLQDAMSRQAQAERERQARVTLASAEEAIAQQVLHAAEIYQQNPVALQLRQMNLLYEMNKDRGTTVLIPTEMAQSLGASALAVALSAAAAKQG